MIHEVVAELPELLPSPPGHTSVADRMSSQVELSVDAQTNTTFAP